MAYAGTSVRPDSDARSAAADPAAQPAALLTLTERMTAPGEAAA